MFVTFFKTTLNKGDSDEQGKASLGLRIVFFDNWTIILAVLETRCDWFKADIPISGRKIRRE